MRTRGAILREVPGTYEVVELELEEPRQGEIMVKVVASGMCHSDDHIATGDLPSETLPMCSGHEGAGVVVQVGPHTPGWQEGDHVVLSCLPSCGRCRWCATGMGNLCDLNATLLRGARFDDPDSFRMSLDGVPVGQWCGISTFSEYTTVGVTSAVKIDPSIPLETACLVGCGVNTGWGSAVNIAQVQPGDTVVIMGIGGVGAFALQGALHAGASNVIAVDPLAFKRGMATRLGATHTVADMDEATEVARSVTDGQGADSAIITVGVLDPDHVRQAFAAIRKAGSCVVTSLGPSTDVGIPISLFELTLYQKRLLGSMFGGVAPMRDIVKMLDMYTAGQLKLDEIITTSYTLDEVNQGYADMHAGRNVRGVITFGEAPGKTAPRAGEALATS
jgi:S-(hydroxymethyl)glutathione dehydrogenase/alcohol dehydrogenase